MSAVIMSETSKRLAVEPSAIKIPLAPRLADMDRDGQLTANSKLIADAIDGYELELGQLFWKHYNATPALKQQATGALLDHALAIGVEYSKRKFGDPTSQIWCDMARDFAWSTEAAGMTISAVLAALAVSTDRTVELLVDRYADDPMLLARAIGALNRINVLEADVMSAFMSDWRMHQNAGDRARHADVFRDKIAINVMEASALGTQLRGQASDTSDATRGMLGKASEVAAAAEQSATAMRDAAHTAAGLIRAIEEARSEVEIAADIATRAAVQAGDAVRVSSVLTDTAKSIESILGLIRDVAGQTNLLALNATIEAARAGDAGRGFAVVAQEVKSLANQTARATDDIAAKIAAIQSATRSTVDTNTAIRDTVAEVQASATRIRQAMDAQAQTVTMITAAVDETALAADTMSTTIASIRQDTEEVATEIDALEIGFDSVNAQLARLQDATGDYVKLVA
ncbi:MAG: methyl-accepting chemotaxis protein [Sphingomonadaceae bacterium]